MSPVCMFVCMYVCDTFPPSIFSEFLNRSSQNFQARPTLTQHTICNPYRPSEPYLSLPLYLYFYYHILFWLLVFIPHTLIYLTILSYYMLTYLTLLPYPTLNFILYLYLHYHIPFLLQIFRLLSIKPNGRYN